jgi:hypothetical protein
MAEVIFAVSVLLLSACSSPSMDPAFQPYVDTFVAQAIANGWSVSNQSIHVTIKFGSTQEFGSDIAGDCSSGSGFSDPSITIDPTFWNQSFEWYRQALINHELGHCFLGRGHTEAMDAAGCPTSLMNPDQFGATCIPTDQTALYKELFAGAVEQAPLGAALALTPCHRLALGLTDGSLFAPLGAWCAPGPPPNCVPGDAQGTASSKRHPVLKAPIPPRQSADLKLVAASNG